MIETDCGMYYTGISTDVGRRFKEHKTDNKKGARFFRGRSPKAIVFMQTCSDRSEASKLEARIKKLTKVQKQQLIISAEPYHTY